MINLINIILMGYYGVTNPFKWSENLQTNYVDWRNVESNSEIPNALYPVQGEPIVDSFITITSNHSYEEYKFNPKRHCYEWVGGRGLGIGQELNL